MDKKEWLFVFLFTSFIILIAHATLNTIRYKNEKKQEDQNVGVITKAIMRPKELQALIPQKAKQNDFSELTITLKSGAVKKGLYKGIASEKLILEIDGKNIPFLKKEIASIEGIDAPQRKREMNVVTLYFHNGDVLSGKLIEETSEEYVVNWMGGNVRFLKKEITKVVEGDHTKE